MVKSFLSTIIISLLLVSTAFGGGGVSVPDPLALQEYAPGTLRDTGALSLRSQTLNPAVRNLIIIAAGQSNMADVGPSGYSPTNSTVVDQLNLYDGGIYNVSGPAIGTQLINNPAPGGTNPAIQLADNLISAGLFDRVIVEPVAFTSSPVAVWDTGVLSNRITAAVKRILGRGIQCGTTNVTCIALWGQGESDCQNGTAQAAYTAALNNVIAASRRAGFTVSGGAGNGLWFVAMQSYIAGAACSSIQAAQAAVVNHAAGIWAGPNADALAGSVCGSGANAACRQSIDNTHFTDAGVYSYVGTGGGGWRAALHAFGAPF